ncbi:MAG: hypothetical protein M3Q07_13510, partial [Pseudobdellovibrionaceae bacterium]|nr:hypothetical protein [Pseudobdellovibrionaceae bacterium]
MTEADLETKAAEGDTEAQCSLAFLYEIGIEREQDYRKAAHYWQMAANAGRQLAIDKIELLLAEGKIQASWLESAQPQAVAPRAPAEHWAGLEMAPKVLMADDEEEFRILMGEVLETSGFRVVHA